MGRTAAPLAYVAPDEQPLGLPESEVVVVGPSTFLEGEHGVISKRSFGQETVLFTIRGRVSARRTKYTFQCGPSEHIDPVDPEGNPGFGQYTNHSCTPNAYVKLVARDGETSIEVVTLTHIEIGDEVTIDYSAMEFEIANPVRCACGARTCRGRIVGFRELDEAVKRRHERTGMIPGYLLDLDRSQAEPAG
jgi:hypothetical protein